MPRAAGRARRAPRDDASPEGRRSRKVDPVEYPANLPITERREELLAALRDHQVVIVAGETGSGKSTQLPKLCLEAGRGRTGLIGHTQPRRIAARTIAERVAQELGVELGTTIGYQVRFTDRVGPTTQVKLMTDGILLAETQRDRELRRYDTIIVDEAHERSLNVDFLLGYLTRLLDRRPDLSLVVTSATIDTAIFSAHFGGAPVIEVSGRTHPVEVRYRPFAEHPDDDRDQVRAVMDAVDELAGEGPGDVLVFLSGEREIHDTAEALRRRGEAGTEVLALYARLSSAEQHRIFEPHTCRRIVLSTNVAETSLTVPGVRYVVDAGTARISRYNRRLKVQRLPIEPVSQASANQRAGRCGRVAPGICIRLYGEDDFSARAEFTEPEILRTNLASVILQMTALGLGDIAAFPFVEPPDARSISDGVAVLNELGALRSTERNAHLRLTPVGTKLARLPLDPRLGRMVLEAAPLGSAREVMIIAAALSIQDPRERPADKAVEAAEAHRRFAGDDRSDFLAYVRMWDHLRAMQKELSGNQFRKACRAQFLNYLRVREWQDLYSQLRQISGSVGVRASSEAAHPDHVHRAVLSGLLSQIGMRDGTEPGSTEFRGARNARFTIAPGSALTRRPPRWVMAAELVETDRLRARVAARIQPEWAERLAAHLVTHEYGEPYWDPARAAVMCKERVLLYGLPIVAGRPMDYAKVDPVVARAMFLRHALVEDGWSTTYPFLADNRRLVDGLHALHARTRRHDLVIDDDDVFAFYDQRVGPDVVSPGHFDSWWKSARAVRPHLLTMTEEALLGPATPVDPSAFPDVWAQGDLALAVSYENDPDSPYDGVTVHVPLAVLNRLSGDGFDLLVPGLREELVGALIRTLPKAVRRQLGPAAEGARKVAQRIAPGDGPLVRAVAAQLREGEGAVVPVSAFEPERLPMHLRMTFAVEDAAGIVIAFGKDLAALQSSLRPRVRATIAHAAGGLERAGALDWEFGTIPRTIHASTDGNEVVGHPALVDDGESVALRVLTSEWLQQHSMRAGTRRLLLLTLPSPRAALARGLGSDARLALGGLGVGSTGEIVDQCVSAAVELLLGRHGGPAWDEATFRTLQAAVRAELVQTASQIVADIGRVIVAAAGVAARLADARSDALAPSIVDARAQLRRLVRPGFVTAAGARRIVDVERYVRAISRRLDRLADEPAKDRARMLVAQGLERQYTELLGALAPSAITAKVVDAGWMLEELRVSLFAQVLGTAYPVSEQRVRRELTRLRTPSRDNPATASGAAPRRTTLRPGTS